MLSIPPNCWLCEKIGRWNVMPVAMLVFRQIPKNKPCNCDKIRYREGTQQLFTRFSAFVEILQSLQCKIFQYTFLWHYPLKFQDFFSLCQIQQQARLQLDHRKLGPSEMGLLWPKYHKTQKCDFMCDILLWKSFLGYLLNVICTKII